MLGMRDLVGQGDPYGPRRAKGPSGGGWGLGGGTHGTPWDLGDPLGLFRSFSEWMVIPSGLLNEDGRHYEWVVRILATRVV